MRINAICEFQNGKTQQSAKKLFLSCISAIVNLGLH